MAKKEMTALERMLQSATASRQSLGSVDDPMKARCPLLFHWLTNVEAGPKHLKEPGRLTIKATPGGFLVTLTDESLAVAIDASSETIDGLWPSLEAALTSPAPALRTWGRKGVRLKPKSKKEIDET